jgi:hypothetical protein
MFLLCIADKKLKKNMNLVEDVHRTIHWKFPMKFGSKENNFTNTDRWRVDNYTKRILIKGKNKITELRAILQRESQNS